MMPITELCAERAQSLQELSRFSRPLAHPNLERARATLSEIVADHHLWDRLELTRDGNRYTRTLLFGDGQISAWAILWPPRSQTCIHDHHCSCCFGVVRGTLKEVWFRTVGDQQVEIDAVAHREPGYVAAMLPTGPNIHQMINYGKREALSVHIYGLDHRMHDSSIRREYRVLPKADHNRADDTVTA